MKRPWRQSWYFSVCYLVFYTCSPLLGHREVTQVGQYLLFLGLSLEQRQGIIKAGDSYTEE